MDKIYSCGPIRPALLACLLGLIAGGCGRSTSPQASVSTVAVKGKVSFEHEPLINGKIAFEDSNDEFNAGEAKIEPDGGFSLSLRPGSYNVTLSGETNSYESLPAYLDIRNSGVVLKVEPGKTDYSIEILDKQPQEQQAEGVVEEVEEAIQ